MKYLYISLAIVLAATLSAGGVKAQTFSETTVGQQINAHLAAFQNFFTTQLQQPVINDISRSITNFLNDVSEMDTNDSQSLSREWGELYMNLKGHVGSDPLMLGDRGLSVSILQSALREDSSIYPEGLVTGFFGQMTQNAVMNFQSREGLPSTGVVDEMTFRKLAQKNWPKLRSELNLHIR